nr:Calx-beta domain-containing protein [uncultured Allomuricauda sp.]
MQEILYYTTFFGQVAEGILVLINCIGVNQELMIRSNHVSFLFLTVAVFFFFESRAQVSEDFESGTATGWTTSGTSSTGTFVVANPTAESSGGVTTQLEDDHTAAPGVNAYFTATNSSAGNADVDGGTSITTSPVYNIALNSQLSIWYFFGQRDNGDDANDFFLLEYSINGGVSYTNLVSIGDVTTNAVWTEATTAIPAGSNLVIRVTVSDGSGAGDIIEGGIDDLAISTIAPEVIIDDVVVDEDAGTVNLTVTHTGPDTSGPFTVNYQTNDGGAIAGSDYTTDSGTLNFNGTSGDTDQITISILDDLVFESSEDFTISFTSTSDGSVDISDTATITINDDDNDPNTTRAYEERVAINLMGNFKMFGNSNLQCTSGCPVTPVSNNPSVVMGYADVDLDGTTVNSSSHSLSLPVGSTVQWAGLYWGGVYNSSNGGITNPAGTLSIDQVKLMDPTTGTYSTINSEVRNIETTTFGGWNTFMSYADVTSIVQSGGNGNYFVADIALVTGSSFTGPHGGWTMVVIYNDPADTARNVSVWDGFDFFGFGANDSFTVTGLLTPSIGTFETHVGYYGMDGEASSTGDFVSIEGTSLFNGLNPASNTLNGTISEYGVDLGTRNPNFTYSWGVDIDVFDASGLVPNNATDMDVILGSSSEGIWGGVFVTSNEIAFPTVATSSFNPTTITQGDESTVTITIENPSNGVSLTNLALTNNLPAGMTIAATPDASSSCGGTISAVSGATSFMITGVSLPAGTTCSFTFDVTTATSGVFTNTISPSDITNDQNIPLSGTTTSDLTVLARPTTVITNRKITYRVDKD